VLHHPARCDTLGIVLRPAGAYALLARPLGDLGPGRLDARDVLPGIDVLAARCAGMPRVRDRFAAVARWIRSRLADARAPDPAIASASG